MTVQVVRRGVNREKLLQAAVEFGRTLGAFAVAVALESLAVWIGLLELDPTTASFLTLFLTGLLRALGQFLRGPDAPAEPIVVEPMAAEYQAQRRGATVDEVPVLEPIRRVAHPRRYAFFLPF